MTGALSPINNRLKIAKTKTQRNQRQIRSLSNKEYVILRESTFISEKQKKSLCHFSAKLRKSTVLTAKKIKINKSPKLLGVLEQVCVYRNTFVQLPLSLPIPPPPPPLPIF